MKNVNQEVSDYLNRASKHLFIINDKDLMFIAKHNDEYYKVTETNAIKIDYKRMIAGYGNNAKNVISEMLFPQHGEKRIAVRQNVHIKEQMKEMMEQIPTK